MATYLELKQQAEKLMAQAEEMRQQETQQAIDEIKAKMKAYGLTAQDLGFGGGGTRARRAPRAKSSGTDKAVKYRGPNGETWSGGRGRKPQWVRDALASGKSLEEFQVK
ncbi:H-NS histone family protein [Ramlibacter tataouinensis]|uniref:H-NS histone family protein n=1 Tax=Ramlibacter tataouinensis TaxID=94132 RepID=UPI0022F3F63F|nr:H-NS histone family protein [Ramlibacter tataouinensis]WBY02091.1 H-NS histone family protein [Ramlibacter tataouinensis]